MLKKIYRLKKYTALLATYRVNNVLSDKNIFVYFGREKTDLSMPAKFAFVVSKKISKHAVKRNRIKRLMRESVRLLLKENKLSHINKYMSVVIVARHNALDSDFTAINNSVLKLLTLT